MSDLQSGDMVTGGGQGISESEFETLFEDKMPYERFEEMIKIYISNSGLLVGEPLVEEKKKKYNKKKAVMKLFNSFLVIAALSSFVYFGWSYWSESSEKTITIPARVTVVNIDNSKKARAQKTMKVQAHKVRVGKIIYYEFTKSGKTFRVKAHKVKINE